MPLRFSLREHKSSASFNPIFTFSKPSGSILRVTTSNASIGTGYIFVVIPRAWLHGKYIRWNWQGYATWTSTTFNVLIYDGAYDRTSDVDFPSGAGKLLKGNGLLQTLDTNSGTFGAETKDVQIDVSGGTEDDCTLFFQLSDGWTGQNFWMQIDWAEINSGAGGSGTIFDEQFTDSVTMEKTGTYGDYGYISTGVILFEDAVNLTGNFVVRHTTSVELLCNFEVLRGWVDLQGRFEVGQDSVDLLGKMTVRHSTGAELKSRVGITHSTTLPGEFVVRQMAPVELLAGFDVGQDSANLRALFWIPFIYDFSGSMGISFYWWGSGGFDQNIDFEMWSPTGGWVGSFPDGPARWRQIQLAWKDLREVDLDGTRPDRSQVIGIYWTYHTPGVRRVDGIQTWMRQDLFCKFIVKNADSSDLPARVGILQDGSVELLAQFEVPQGFKDLKAEFYVMVDRFTLIEEQIVTGAAVERVTFTGLDLDTHKNYRLIVEWYSPIEAAGEIWLFYNGDEVKTNYRSQGLAVSTTSESGSRTENPKVGINKEPPWSGSMAVIDIGISPEGYINALVQGRAGRAFSGYGLVSLHWYAQIHNVVQANLTELTISSRNNADAEVVGLGVGSKFRLYGYKSGP